MAYATNTTVSVERSRAEIERLVSKHKCSQFGCGTDYEQGRAIVQFRAHERIVRFVLELPKPEAFQKRQVRGRWVLNHRKDADWEQACRTRWRALVLVVKGKLESVESQIATFEEEFMPYIVMPDGKTVAEHLVPAIAQAYANNAVSGLLPESF